MTNDQENCWVCGEGPIPAKCMIVGEAPGPDECKELRPFIGKAGKFLRAALGSHDHIRISNVAKSFPGRDSEGKIISPPPPVQIQQELPYLVQEMGLVRPEVILALGGTAIKELTGYDGVAKARAKAEHSGGYLPLLTRFDHRADVIPTWHPSHIDGRGREDEPSWREDIDRFVRHRLDA